MSRRRFMSKKRNLVQVIQEITASTTWVVPPGCTSVGVFLCGGGGGGGGPADINNYPNIPYFGSGGGGGYTKTYYNVSVYAGQSILITVGIGGIGGYTKSNGGDGGYSQFLNSTYRANGGYSGKYGIRKNGGDGGSGGGAGYRLDKDPDTYSKGGYNGDSGGIGTVNNGVYSTGGDGQGSNTTCPFNGKVYGCGGNGCGNGKNTDNVQSGAGKGAWSKGDVNAKPNTGGGGGGAYHSGEQNQSGTGGSGIVILRYYKYVD